jgi:hypothetical protein
MSGSDKIMKKNISLKVDIRQAIVNCHETIDKNYEVGNRIWQGVLRLVITLSSSLLLVTIALVEKIFNSTIPPFLIISWVLFFVSIGIGIVAEINEVIFYNNMSGDISNQINKYEKLLASGTTEVPYRPEDDPYQLIYNDIKWGAITIISFILATLFMCVALLGRITQSVWICRVILMVGSLFVLILSFYLINKRKKVTPQ